MKQRKSSLDPTVSFEEMEEAVEFPAVSTRCPQKYLTVDLETGDVWAFNVEDDSWKRLHPEDERYRLLSRLTVRYLEGLLKWRKNT